MKLYRSRQGLFLGVCQGLADRTGYPAKYFRAAFIVGAFFFHWWSLILYTGAAVLLPVKRPEGYESDGFRENLDDLKDDAADFARKEYMDFRRAGRKKERENRKPRQAGEGQ